MVMVHPYEATRLTSFLHPVLRSSRAQRLAVGPGQMAIGSGGICGVGLGQSRGQGCCGCPEAQTDFILAVVGEELGVLGILVVVSLYGMIAYAGMRTARRAATRYTKLLASGLTSLILCQGILNIFVVLGIAPLTGVPLPFISYAPTNLLVMLGSIGILLGIARPGRTRAAAGRRRRAATYLGGGTMTAPLILIATGGTAGHVVPALAVADALRANGAEVHFVGGDRAEAELVPAGRL